MTWLHYDPFIYALSALLTLDWIAFVPMLRPGFAGSICTKSSLRETVFLSVLSVLWLGGLFIIAFAAAPLRLSGFLTLWLIFRYFFIQQRWSSVRRGFGAPGFMSNFIAQNLLLLELSAWMDSQGRMVEAMKTVIYVDFALIILCAGTYKALVGYLKNNGMEFGRVNPSWGYHWNYFRTKSPHGWYPALMNWMACGLEILAGIMMFIPAVQKFGALLMSLSFVYVSIFIRLGRLAWLMVIFPFIFWIPVRHDLVTIWSGHTLGLPSWAISAMTIGIYCYIPCLFLIKIVQYVNYFSKKTIPEPLQSWFTNLANTIPVIIWRVFTPDVTNFFIRLKEVVSSSQVEKVLIDEHTTYNYRDWKNIWWKLRFLHVTESIALTSVFTTLKYRPSEPHVFFDKLIRYSQSLVPSLGYRPNLLKYEYVRVEKGEHDFQYVHGANFWVDLNSREVREETLIPGFSAGALASLSPINESVRPGSYVPKSKRS